jgi:hypothetical protein
MSKGLEGVKVIEVGGNVAMPIVGMLMGSWGAGLWGSHYGSKPSWRNHVCSLYP